MLRCYDTLARWPVDGLSVAQCSRTHHFENGTMKIQRYMPEKRTRLRRIWFRGVAKMERFSWITFDNGREMAHHAKYGFSDAAESVRLHFRI